MDYMMMKAYNNWRLLLWVMGVWLVTVWLIPFIFEAILAVYLADRISLAVNMRSVFLYMVQTDATFVGLAVFTGLMMLVAIVVFGVFIYYKHHHMHHGKMAKQSYGCTHTMGFKVTVMVLLMIYTIIVSVAGILHVGCSEADELRPRLSAAMFPPHDAPSVSDSKRVAALAYEMATGQSLEAGSSVGGSRFVLNETFVAAAETFGDYRFYDESTLRSLATNRRLYLDGNMIQSNVSEAILNKPKILYLYRMQGEQVFLTTPTYPTGFSGGQVSDDQNLAREGLFRSQLSGQTLVKYVLGMEGKPNPTEQEQIERMSRESFKSGLAMGYIIFAQTGLKQGYLINHNPDILDLSANYRFVCQCQRITEFSTGVFFTSFLIFCIIALVMLIWGSSCAKGVTYKKLRGEEMDALMDDTDDSSDSFSTMAPMSSRSSAVI